MIVSLSCKPKILLERGDKKIFRADYARMPVGIVEFNDNEGLYKGIMEYYYNNEELIKTAINFAKLDKTELLLEIGFFKKINKENIHFTFLVDCERLPFEFDDLYAEDMIEHLNNHIAEKSKQYNYYPKIEECSAEEIANLYKDLNETQIYKKLEMKNV